MNVTVTTNYPGSNIAKGVCDTVPATGRDARKAMAGVLNGMGYVIEGSIGKPIRKGVYMVAIAPRKGN